MQDKKILKEAIAKGAVAVWTGEKIKNGKPTGEIVTVFAVEKKKKVAKAMDLSGKGRDVVEVGTIKGPRPIPKPQKITKKVVAQGNTEKERPCRMGNSIGSFRISAGTAGAVVKKNGIRTILSNNHVLAASNTGKIGDEIYQPGPYDGGGPEDAIGTLYQFIPIHFQGEESNCQFSKAYGWTVNAPYAIASKIPIKGIRPKTRFQAVVPQADANLVDCALCLPYRQEDISEEIIDIGIPQGLVEPAIGTEIHYNGRTTGYEVGKITGLDGTVMVQYDSNVALFTGQIISTIKSLGGNSGSAVLDMNNNIVGLLFAGGDDITIMNPIHEVFSALGVTL